MSPSRTSGYTVMELLIAVTIASIVTALGFMAYMSISDTFFRRSRDAETLGRVVVLRKQITGICNQFTTVSNWNEYEVTGMCKENGDTMKTLRYRDNALVFGTDTISLQINSFSFSFINKKTRTDNSKMVVLWEGTVGKKKCWIGGQFITDKR